MIFWIFVILTVLPVALIVATAIASNKYSISREDGNKKFVEFAYDNDGNIFFISAAIAIISGIVVFAMLVSIIVTHVTADGYKASNEQKYQALVYKAKAESIRDEFGIVNKEYIDEVQAWNENLSKNKAYQRDFWIGIFYQNIYDDFEIIDLEQIKFMESEE